jgi:hypothetical protein
MITFTEYNIQCGFVNEFTVEIPDESKSPFGERRGTNSGQ